MKFISRLQPFFLSAIANAVLAIGIVVPASAELSPEVYKEWQDKAPEYLVIRVLSVESRQKDERELVRFDVIAEARIEEVTRSASGLKVGT